jgi:hypothetical protein
VILAVGLVLARSGGTNGTTAARSLSAHRQTAVRADDAPQATLQGITRGATPGDNTSNDGASNNSASNSITRARDVGEVGWNHIGLRVTLNADTSVTPSPAVPAAPAAPGKSGVRIGQRDSVSALIASTAVSEQQEVRKRQLDGFFALVASQDVQQYLMTRAYQQALYQVQQYLTAMAIQRQRELETPPKPAPAPAPAATPAPASSGGYAGGVWAALRNCESGGNYAENTGNGFYGAYQFELGTWHGLGYSGYPNDAPPAVQDAAAAALQARSGWGQWPECSRKLGL